MYENPISAIYSEIASKIVKDEEERFMLEVQQAIGYNIDKDELVKALRYDRNQYEKGFRDGLEQKEKWTPVREGPPKDRDWYLGIFKEPDTGYIIPIPFICDYAGKETKATTKDFWILHGFTDIDNPCDYYKNLECVAWRLLPEPYNGIQE